MNILVLTHQSPLPESHGSAHRIMGQARALVRRGHTVTILAPSLNVDATKVTRFDGLGGDTNLEADFEEDLERSLTATPRRASQEGEGLEGLEVVEVPGTIPSVSDGGIKGLFKKLLPGQGNTAFVKEAIKLRTTRKIDLVQLDRPFMIGVAQMLQKTGVPLVYVAHILEADAVRDLLTMGERTEQQVRETADIERKAVLAADLVLAISKQDAFLLNEYYGTPIGGAVPRIEIVPNGVDTAIYRDTKPEHFRNPTVLFVGSGIHYPNKDALWRLYNSIIPQVRRRNRLVQFLFIGPQPPDWLKEDEGIRVLGEVEDVRPSILGASVCVAPLRYGSGSPTKMLEYMAAGKPIVATPEACNALGLEDGVHAVIRAREEDFSRAIMDLLRDSSRMEALGRAARSLAASTYDWQRVGARIEGLYDQLLAVR